MNKETEVKITGRLIAAGSDSIGGDNIEIDVDGYPLVEGVPYPIRVPLSREQVKKLAPFLYSDVEVTVRVLHE